MDAASKRNFSAIQETMKRHVERADMLEKKIAALENQQQQWENKFNQIQSQMFSMMAKLGNVR